jgi:NAD kinase
MTIEYAIIVKNKTRLESLIERFNTKDQARFYIESSGGDFTSYLMEHEIFHDSLTYLQTRLSKIIKHKTIDRSFVSSFIFSSNQVIIVIGQDGLVANTAKYSGGLPIIAVNPDKERYDGILLPFGIDNFIPAVENVIHQEFAYKTVRMAEATLNDGQRLLAFNDLFIGASSHISARYKISYNKDTEEHSSSGLIVSTRAGSTGWLSSVFNMAYSVTNILEDDLEIRQPHLREDELMFAVREPFLSKRSQIGITSGIITSKHTLQLESLMPTSGVIFSDGIESDFMRFNSGSIATIGIAKETATMVMNK